jgi:hypothetical protein
MSIADETYAEALERARWNSYMFEFEKIAAALHAQGFDFKEYIEMATLAWNITGQSVNMQLFDSKERSPQ